ncbi:MAG TPA: alpha/beta hydrolase, partial [Marisediminicola sp.]|nr:alpha/beta hydrolase [Marisediminicola sp.]
PHFSVYAVDRRGRGDSTDTAPYAPEREGEDLAAVIGAIGGEAAFYGHSSGAAIGLLAAARGVPITRLAAYEPPYTGGIVGGGKFFTAWRADVEGALAAGDRERASVLFMEGTGADAETIAGMSQLPFWEGMLAVAHTLPYDLAVLGDGTVPAERFASITVPTLVLYGGDSEAWAESAASTIAEAIPRSRTAAIAGQTHNVDPAAIVPVLVDFFS